MQRRHVLTIAGFAVWTVAVWLGRVRNVVADDDLTAGGRTARVVLAAVFIAAAVAVAATLTRARTGEHGRVERLRTAVDVLFVITAVVWIIRGVAILVDGEHGAGFKVVHTALAVVSIGWGYVARAAAQQTPGLEHDRTLQPG